MILKKYGYENGFLMVLGTSETLAPADKKDTCASSENILLFQ
jgi:hypothetical protein